MEHEQRQQKQTVSSEKPSQLVSKNAGITLEDNRPQSTIQKKANNTGLPNQLKSGIENLSGHSMDDVKVHYNSSKPAQLNAHAYAQGTDIHVASGQEKHLPHEAWHVVQQKQGRVKPTMQLKAKVNINDDKSLEKEADVMGAKALQMKEFANFNTSNNFTFQNKNIIQEKGKLDSADRVKDILKKGKRKIGSNIGVLRPYLGDQEEDFLFIYGLISGFTLNDILSSLNIINSDKKSKSNKTLMGGIAHEIQKVVKLNQNYPSYLGEGISEFKSGRISELVGLQGELSICSRLIASGKVVNSLGKQYDLMPGSQEVDLTVEHNGQFFFIEIAASVSKLKDKISGGGQMEGYKKLVKNTPKSKFAYTSPDLSKKNLTVELISKLKAAGAWLVIGSQFYAPQDLQKLILGETDSSSNAKKTKKKSNKGTGKARNKIAKELKSYNGKSSNLLSESSISDQESDLDED